MSMGHQRAVPLGLGVVTLAGVGLLLIWDFSPNLFPASAHDFLGAFPLAMIACVWLIHEVMRRAARAEVVKAILLAAAFFFWAANQLWPTLRQATLYNDIAIALFVFDVFLTMTWHPVESARPRSEIAELAKAADK
jgi:hypothetical protein